MHLAVLGTIPNTYDSQKFLLANCRFYHKTWVSCIHFGNGVRISEILLRAKILFHKEGAEHKEWIRRCVWRLVACLREMLTKWALVFRSCLAENKWLRLQHCVLPARTAVLFGRHVQQLAMTALLNLRCLSSEPQLWEMVWLLTELTF